MSNTVLVSTRISQEIKEEIEEQARDSEISTSECIRNCLEDFFKPNRKPLGTLVIGEGFYPEEPQSSAGYTFVYLWIVKCKLFVVKETNETLQRIKATLENIKKDETFSIELRIEFLKVLNDVNRYLTEPDYQGKQFQFCIDGYFNSFDYSRFFNEIPHLLSSHE